MLDVVASSGVPVIACEPRFVSHFSLAFRV